MRLRKNHSQMEDELIGDEYRLEIRPCYGDVVAGIRRLGSSAVDQFLDELAPIASDVAGGEPTAEKRLGRLLHDWGVTVAAIESAGGLDGLAKKAELQSHELAIDVDSAIAKLVGLLN